MVYSTIIYTLLALGATTLGAISGMGGGVIMKPVMDLLGQYSAADIGLLSCITVFFMSIVSLLKSTRGTGTQNVSAAGAVLLGTGAVAGGFIGQFLFEKLCTAVNDNGLVTVVQNAVLLVIICVVFVYMLNSEKVKNRSFRHWSIYAATGIFLGCMSSFLGIGGGPINVAALMFLFAFPIKTATFVSIVIILFAQISKLATVAFSTGFSVYDLRLAPFMICAAIAGGFLGTWIKNKVRSKTVTRLFNAVQVLITIICVLNIVKSV